MDDIPNIVFPCRAGPTSCGYCSPPGQRSQQPTSYHSAALEAVKLTCAAYQEMIDRGWRRSGTYCYKPDMKITCCPQYTIKLDALEFKPSRSQRKLLNRWNRYILQEEADSPTEVNTGDETSKSKKSGKKSQLKSPPFTSLSECLHASESNVHPELEPTRTFEVFLEPASYTPQKFALYKKYQSEIHNDRKSSPSGFKRFLVDSPLQVEPIPYPNPPPSHLPLSYGSYHQLYKVDGQLMAMAVLDILPYCVSSVYFMYDNTWERFSLGKLSALREVSLAREIRGAGAPEMSALYMGFYIHSCQKMRYKGDYSPSYLADPETYEWYQLEKCIPLLDKHRYACFSDPSHSSNDNEESDLESDRGSEASDSPDSEEFEGVNILARSTEGKIVTKPVKEAGYLSYAQVRQELGSCIRGLGTKLAKEISFTL